MAAHGFSAAVELLVNERLHNWFKRSGAKGSSKAQVDVVSVILIAGIMIALVGAAYVWGVPLIEKRTTIAQFDSTESFMVNVNSKISEIASAEGGRQSIDIPQGVLIRVIPNSSSRSDNNSIIADFNIPQPIAWNTSTIYLGETVDVLTEIGKYGVSPPYRMFAQFNPSAKGGSMNITLHYRELDNGRGYKIIINDGKPIDSGTQKLTVSYSRTQTLKGAAANGGDLVAIYIDADAS